MIEGVLRHCTDMEVERQYVDSHGQSEVAFAFSHLLGFDLMPRLKAIARQKLSRPGPGNVDAYPNAFNTYDSLGEAYMEMGDNEKAIANYKKSIELNAGNENGKDMLKKLGVALEELDFGF